MLWVQLDQWELQALMDVLEPQEPEETLAVQDAQVAAVTGFQEDQDLLEM